MTWSVAGAGNNIGAFHSTITKRSVSGNDALNFGFLSETRSAFEEWSEAGNIEFLQVKDPGGAAGSRTFPDIRIFFGEIPGSLLSLAFTPSSSRRSGEAGDILIDPEINSEGGFGTFEWLIRNSIGRAIGLTDDDGFSVMNQDRFQRTDFVSFFDEQELQEVYGEQDNEDPVYFMPSNMQDLDILQAPDDIIINANDRRNVIDGSQDNEAFIARRGNDKVIARDGFDTILGNQGNDTLEGGPGDDRIFGGNGNDSLKGGDDEDRIVGGDGNDILRGGNGADIMMGSNGNDQLFGGAQADLLNGGDGRDTLNGGTGGDTLNGGAQADTLYGNTGYDSLSGNASNDRLYGNDGNDTLRGNANNDTLNGGRHDDALIGGTGSDVFVFRDGDGNDTIRDFDATNNQEKINLSNVSSLSNITDVMNAATQDGDDVIIQYSTGNSITLEDVQLSDLDGGDFTF